MQYSLPSTQLLDKRNLSVKSPLILSPRQNSKNYSHGTPLPHTERSRKVLKPVLQTQIRVLELLTRLAAPGPPSSERAQYALKALSLISEDSQLYKKELRSIVHELDQCLFLSTKRLSNETFNRVADFCSDSGKSGKIPFFSLYSYYLAQDLRVQQENQRFSRENAVLRSKLRTHQSLEQRLLSCEDVNRTSGKSEKTEKFINELRTRILKLESENKHIRALLDSHSSVISQRDKAIIQLKSAHSKNEDEITKLKRSTATKDESLSGFTLHMMNSGKRCEELTAENERLKQLTQQQGRLLSGQLSELDEVLNSGLPKEKFLQAIARFKPRSFTMKHKKPR